MTLLIAKSKKTDKVDVVAPMDMPKGWFISECPFRIARHPVSGRLYGADACLVEDRASHKNSIHEILLQMSFRLGRQRRSRPCGWRV